MTFDYRSPAELFIAERKGRTRQGLGYRHFATCSEGHPFRSGRFSDFPSIRTLGTWMQVGDERFDSKEIRRLYESDDYPLRPCDAERANT